EARLAAEVWQAPMDLEEHLLREIVGEAALGDHPVDQAIHQILVAVHELGERGVVAGPAPLDQFAFVDVHPQDTLESTPPAIVSFQALNGHSSPAETIGGRPRSNVAV